MNRLHHSATNPSWSPRKRLGVTLVGATAILTIALLIGMGLYALGIRAKLFTSQSLKRLILQSLVRDQTFVDMVTQAEQSTTCVNETIGMQLTHPKSLVDVATTSAQRCLLFAATPADKPVVIIHLLAIERVALLEKLARSVTHVTVDSLVHPKYQASSVRANQGGLPYAGYVLETAPQQSLLVEVVPSLGQFERAGVAIAQSVTLP